MESRGQGQKESWKIWVKRIKILCGRKDRLIIFFLAGVLLLVIGMPVSETKKTENQETEMQEKATDKESKGSDTEAYAEYLEKKLAAVLSEVEGVGRTEVMITLESSSEKVIGKDRESESESVQEEDSQGGSRSTAQNKSSETAIYENGDGQQQVPYITKEITPSVSGVIVIAEGGDDAVIVQSIIEAVQALFEIDTHKIKVMKCN